MKKDLKKFALDMDIKGLVVATPIFIKGLSEFAKDGGIYDIIDNTKK